MANPEHLAKLTEGVETWNQWRAMHREVTPDLTGTDLSRAYLRGANLYGADLSRADLRETDLAAADLAAAELRRADLRRAYLEEGYLSGADLTGANLRETDLTGAGLQEADLTGAKLSRANLYGADLSEANLHEADLRGAYLREANLHEADLSGADLSGADLSMASLVRTNLEEAILTGCRVYGISVWDVRLGGTIQSNLVITPSDESAIQVDNLTVAQFVYLLLNNEKIRDVIDTITAKVVLILGRFTPDRKIVLDAIRQELRKRDYLPVLFDFEKPSNRDITETVRILAHMARFVIADITDAKSIPQELMAIVPNLPSVPVQPLLLASQHEYGMFEHLRRFPWVLKPVLYKNQRALLMELEPKVITPAEAKANQQTRKSKSRQGKPGLFHRSKSGV